MKALEIHAFNVGNGYVTLIRIPKRSRRKNAFRNILINAGNALCSDQVELDKSLLKAMQRIHKLAEGRVDLYVITANRADCMRGPLLLHQKRNKLLRATVVWAPIDAAYLQTNHKRASSSARIKELWSVMTQQRYHIGTPEEAEIDQILKTNNEESSTSCLEFIKQEMISDTHNLHFLHGDDINQLNSTHSIADLSAELWAPKKRRRKHIEHFNPVSWATYPNENGDPVVDRPVKPAPPRGVSMSDFYRLTRDRELSTYGNAKLIQRRTNNRSMVINFNWKGRQLLFSGLAEQRLWLEMSASIMENDRTDHAVDFWQVPHDNHTCFTPIKLIEKLLSDESNSSVDNSKPITLLSTTPNHDNLYDEGGALKKIRELSDCFDTSSTSLGEAMQINLSSAQ